MCTTDCRDTKHIFSQLQKLHNARLKIDMKKCIVLGRRGMLKSRTRCVFSSSFWMGVAHSFLNLKGFLLCEFLHYMMYMEHCISKLTVFWPLKSKYINTIWHFFCSTLQFTFSIGLLQWKLRQIAFFKGSMELVALRSSSNVNTKFFGIQAWKNSHCNHHQMDEIIGLFAFEREIPLQTQQRKIK